MFRHQICLHMVTAEREPLACTALLTTGPTGIYHHRCELASQGCFLQNKKNTEEKYNGSLIYFSQVYDCLVLDTYALIILKSLILTTSS